MKRRVRKKRERRIDRWLDRSLARSLDRHDWAREKVLCDRWLAQFEQALEAERALKGGG